MFFLFYFCEQQLQVTQDCGELFKVRIGFAERAKEKSLKLQKVSS